MSDYFAPAFQVEVNGSRLTADVSKNIQQVSVVSMPDTMDTFSMVVANAYPEMRWTHTDDAELFRVGNSVTIAMGYVGDLQELMDGEITRLSPTFPDSGMPTISIDGLTRLHWLQGDKKARTFQNMTDKQIAEKIAQDVGLQPQVEDTGGQYDYVMQPNLTDLQFLRSRAGLIRYEVLVKGKTLIFRKAKEASAKVYTLVWGHTQEAFSGPDTLPLNSFSPELNTIQQVSQVTVRGYDVKTKQAIIGRARSGDEDTTMGGSQTGPQLRTAAFHRPKEYVRVNVPVASQEEADEDARARYNEFGMALFSAGGETIGIPDLKSGSKVELRGLGRLFNGLYYIYEATHSIGGSGYQTSFKAHRNAVS